MLKFDKSVLIVLYRHGLQCFVFVLDLAQAHQYLFYTSSLVFCFLKFGILYAWGKYKDSNKFKITYKLKFLFSVYYLLKFRYYTFFIITLLEL